MSSQSMLPGRRELFYDGHWQPALNGETIEIISPSTQDLLGVVANAQKKDIDAVVASADKAFVSWSAWAPRERAACLRKAADVLLAHKERIAAIDALDCGNPVKFMINDVNYMADCLNYYAGLVVELKGETIPVDEKHFNYTLREPLGVVAHILAFNHPALFVGWTIGASLGAGNTVVVKPSDQTPLSALYIAELFADIFPPGVFNVVTGDRNKGSLLTAHPTVRKVIFIGSVGTGKAILRSAADTIKHVSLEMGGKNALVVYPDADLDKACDVAIAGMNFAWCGQSCGSTSRLFIHESVYDELLQKVLKKVKDVEPGDPLDPNTMMGCLVSREHYEKVKSYIQIGIEEGATLACGGKLNNPDLSKGNFLAPTIFVDVQQSMRIAQEEIFGPVLSVLKWRDEDQLFDEVNSVDYGLTGAICTQNLAQAHKAAKRIRSGYIWINQAGPHFLGAPFGGQKQSGLGRLGCFQTMLDCTQLKNINVLID